MKRLPNGMLTLAILLATIPFSTARAETSISKSYKYFSIGGRTAEELDRELAAHGPKAKGVKGRHPGLTEIKFGGSVTYVSNENGCEVSRVKVTLSTAIILPRWRNRSRADKNLRLVWDTLAADIKRHEERHAEIARNHARRLDKALQRLPRERTCDALKAKASAVTDKEIAAHDKDQERFDRVETINFEKRMIRLLNYRAKKYD